MAPTRHVVVAGDVALDWYPARTRTLVDSGIAWNADDRIETDGQQGSWLWRSHQTVPGSLRAVRTRQRVRGISLAGVSLRAWMSLALSCGRPARLPPTLLR